MAENETNKTTLFDTGASAATKKAAESIATRIIDKGIEIYDKNVKQMQIKTGDAFCKYLDNAYLRLNKMKTLATGQDTVSIIGKNSIHVNTRVHYSNVRERKSMDIDVITVEDLLQLGTNVLITGTGGAGKTMLMKYLFLNTKNRDSYVPVFLELRKVASQKAGEVSIPNLIYTCMKDFDVEMTSDMVEYSLQYGGYLFLFDGYDEVKESLSDETARAIQQFSAKYPNNAYIVTSRGNDRLPALFQTFEMVKSLPLDIHKAQELAARLGGNPDKNKAFCEELKEHLFEQHKDFAENPLLLTMMFLVHVRNGSIPDHLADFYGKCFDALYSSHDSYHKDNYKRSYHGNLTEKEFKQIFASFCFATYFREKYEFGKEELLKFLSQSIGKGTDKKISPEDYLLDLIDEVCLLIKDGRTYKFVHRNFQTFFAALHMSEKLTDEQQQKMADISWGSNFSDKKKDFHKLFFQINPEQFKRNVLEPVLQEMMTFINESDRPDEAFLKTVFMGFVAQREKKKHHGLLNTSLEFRGIQEEEREDCYTVFTFPTPGYGDVVIYLFEWIFKKFDQYNMYKIVASKEYTELLDEYVALFEDGDDQKRVYAMHLSLDALDTMCGRNEILFREKFYRESIKEFQIPQIRQMVSDWLAQQEEKRRKSKEASELDEILDALI